MVKPTAGKARGRDEVRRAVLRSARTKFAAKGISVTLRELAEDAGVNLGLIHKHLGNKDDILSAVLARNDQQSTNVIESVDSLAEAVRRLFLVGVADPEYVRIATWLILEDRTDLLPAFNGDSVDIISRIDQSPGAVDVRVMLALAAIAGWSLFGSGILNYSGVADSGRVDVEVKIAELLAAIVELPGFGPGDAKST